MVSCPSVECLLGDKLTAFAPHTTGVLFNQEKDLEIAKQLFDVAHLFDCAEDLRAVADSYKRVVQKELSYRELGDITFKDVLDDTFNTSCLIVSHGRLVLGGIDPGDYDEFVLGSKKNDGVPCER